jgi:hypothetical protein
MEANMLSKEQQQTENDEEYLKFSKAIIDYCRFLNVSRNISKVECQKYIREITDDVLVLQRFDHDREQRNNNRGRDMPVVY